ncbi:hypothetical protein BJV78DRAFT_1220721 [Lactifluus subvellereus]|nr:hypothetical protein BJV78DRAFT_1220721 [Lactifluus subvellereus]
MHPPPQLVQWLRQSYPKPSVDENWLQQCYAWVIEEHNLHPTTDMGKIKEHVESQLLLSDLTDSMIHGSGLPHNLAGLQKGSLSGPPILVQIMALTEIGHSAFSLVNVRQTKIDRADLSGLTRGDNEDEADEGPVPNYPRSMLQFELSDGAIKLNAIEYRKIPQLDLENTPLGFKIQLKDVTIRQGIAFLEPRNVVLKGHGVEDLDVNRDRNFLRGLRLRLDPNAQDEPEGDGADREGQQHPPAPAPGPAPAPAIRNAPAPTRADQPEQIDLSRQPGQFQFQFQFHQVHPIAQLTLPFPWSTIRSVVRGRHRRAVPHHQDAPPPPPQVVAVVGPRRISRLPAPLPLPWSPR